MSNVVWAVSYSEPYEGEDLCRIFQTKELAKSYIENLLSDKGKPFLYDDESDDYICYYFNHYFDSETINPAKSECYIIQSYLIHDHSELD